MRYFLVDPISSPTESDAIPVPAFEIISPVPFMPIPKKPTSLIKELVTDQAFMLRHRNHELLEKRQRKRDEELCRYEEHMKQLRRDFPELWAKRLAY